MENRVKNTIVRNNLIDVKKKEHIVLGLSGGPDSVCLFYALLKLREELNISLHPVHINHQFRPGPAEEDQAYVEQLCEKHGLRCDTFVFDCNAIAKKQGISGEEAGRNARYQAFYQVAGKVMGENGLDATQVKIAVAQNQNDQAETLLMRIMRGTGTEGLAGIEYEREGEGGMKVIRPLLDVDRKAIERYCEDHQLEPRRDHTNQEAIYTRNKIRLELIPYMEKNFNPNITEALNRLSAIAREDKDYMDSVVEAFGTEVLTVEEYKKQHPAIRKRILIRRLEGAGLTQGIQANHLEAAEKMILEGKTGTSINLPKGYRVGVDYGEVSFSVKKDSKESTEKRGISPMSDAYNGFDGFDGFDGFVLRTRLPGDYIVLPGVGGRKKIQDVFVDGKVGREMRDQVPVLCLGSEVLWIIGDDFSGLQTGMKTGRKSKNYQGDPEMEQRIFVEFHKKI